MPDWADPIPEDQPKRVDEMVEALDQVNEEISEGPEGAAEGAERRESERRIAERRRHDPELTT